MVEVVAERWDLVTHTDSRGVTTSLAPNFVVDVSDGKRGSKKKSSNITVPHSSSLHPLIHRHSRDTYGPRAGTAVQGVANGAWSRIRLAREKGRSGVQVQGRT
jgi:hypothetical protein